MICSNLGTVYIGLFVFVIKFINIDSLKCVCNPLDCDVIHSKDCPGKGVIVWDPCRCCRVCAKTVGESCGGPNGFSGTCESLLHCITKPTDDLTGICMDFPETLTKNCDKKIVFEPGCEIVNGRCKCWQQLKLCKDTIHHWSYTNLKDCKLNLERYIKKRFIEEYFTRGFS